MVIVKCRWSALPPIAMLLAGCISVPNHSLTPLQREIEGGREVEVSVAQGEIKTNINSSGLAAVTGGGFLAAAIDASIEVHRAKLAESYAKPLRDALIEYDFDSKAQETTKRALTELSWLRSTDYSFVKEVSAENRSAKLDATNSKQMIFVDYEYELSVEFDAIEVNILVAIADKKIPSGYVPTGRLNPKNLVYQRWINVIIPLSNPSSVAEENVKRWAADDALLARQALNTSLESAYWMIKKSLSQFPEEERSIRKSKKIDLSQYHIKSQTYSGRVIEQKDNASLLLLTWPDDKWVLLFNPIG